MSKPKEFWIWNTWFEPTIEDPVPSMCMYVFGTTIDQMNNINEDEKIHVIEYQAYQELELKLKIAREALESYASMDQVFGRKARQALEKIK